MPKRSLDMSARVNGADTWEQQKGPRKVNFAAKTERSHEENQERAYIAASRRADRSIEARVQSARMASDIHKKRTGKGFKISEEIVMKEEMYEEEEDDFPRHYRALAALNFGGSGGSDLQNRAGLYVSTQVAMRTLAHEQEINKLFAEQFPHAAQMSQKLAQSRYWQDLQQNPSPTSPGPSSHSRSQSVSLPAEPSPRQSIASPPPATRHASLDDVGGQVNVASPPALSPTSITTAGLTSTEATPSLRHHSYQSTATSDPQIDPLLTSSMPPSSSIFTSQLPQDVKDIAALGAGFNFGDSMAPFLWGNDMGSTDFSQWPTTTGSQDASSTPRVDGLPAVDDFFNSNIAPTFSTPYDHLGGQQSTIGTPGGGDGDSWENWVSLEE